MKWKPVARVPTGLVSLTQAPQWHTASKTWYARRGDEVVGYGDAACCGSCAAGGTCEGATVAAGATGNVNAAVGAGAIAPGALSALQRPVPQAGPHWVQVSAAQVPAGVKLLLARARGRKVANIGGMWWELVGGSYFRWTTAASGFGDTTIPPAGDVTPSDVLNVPNTTIVGNAAATPTDYTKPILIGAACIGGGILVWAVLAKVV